MKKYFIYHLLFFSLFLFPKDALFSQITTEEFPFSFSKSGLQPLLKVLNIAPPDLKKIQSEDAINDSIPGKLTRIAVPIPVKINSEVFGQWEELTGGDLLWRITIQIEDAQSLDLTFCEFWLPEGGKFFIYSSTTKQSIGAITSKFLKGNKEKPANFSTGIIYGKELTLEYYQPSYVKNRPIITVSNIYYGYRYIKQYTGSKGFGDSGSCQVNVNCSEGQNWHIEKKAIARVYIKTPVGSGWCSGALINNTAYNHEPFFLTANHCLGPYFDAETNPDLSEWIFYWNYEFSGCSNETNEPIIKSTVGATILANNSSSDFALLELDQDPADLFNFVPYYLGWDRSGNAGTGGVGIHHPMGDVKKISTYSISPFNSYCANSNLFWDALFISTTNGHSIMQQGSSGSPLINSSHRIIGQLYGPYDVSRCPAYQCDNPSGQQVAYGKFSVSWTGNGSTDNHRRLRDWLDPCETDQNTLNGTQICSISGPSVVCPSSSSSFTVDSLPPGSTITWQWDTSVLDMVSDQGSNPCDFIATGSGNAWIQAVITTGCEEYEYTTSRIYCSAGIPTIMYLGGPSYIQEGHGDTYYAVKDTWNFDAQYYWSIGPSGYLTSPTNENGTYVTFGSPDTYTLEVTACNSCGCSDNFYLEIDVYGYYRLRISPNPSSSQTTVSIQSTSGEITDNDPEWYLEVYNQGSQQKVLTKNIKGKEFSLNTSNWKEGLYIVRAKYRDKWLNGKLVVGKN